MHQLLKYALNLMIVLPFAATAQQPLARLSETEVEKLLFEVALNAHPPLKFASEGQTLGFFSSLSNNVFLPEGKGPYPAVVLVHHCGGVLQYSRERAKDFLAAGFAVLILDSLSPRGQKTCRSGIVSSERVLKDAYDALAHLHTMQNIDSSRIYVTGGSLGSMTATWAASPEVAALMQSKYRFRASAGWYSNCVYRHAPNLPALRLLRKDIDKPVLLLMAGKDYEMPPEPDCTPLLKELTSQAKPVGWHLYPNAHHTWDSREQDGHVWTNAFGVSTTYRYSEPITVDAMRRTIEFFNQH